MLFMFCFTSPPIMKNLYTAFMAIALTQLLSTQISFAQTTSLKPAPANVSIDGSLSEWGDTLSYTNPETGINYSIANDKTNLYLVVKTDDPAQQNAILARGLTLGIDPKGRKKETFSVSFPVQDDGNAEIAPNPTDQQKKQEIVQTKLERIKADGFKDVENDVFTQQNLYGFKVAINYDAHENLIYEEQIPLSLFHADINPKTEWAFNIKLNKSDQIDKKPSGDSSNPTPGGGGGRHGGGGGMGGAGGRHGGGGGMGGGRGGSGNSSGSHDSEGKSVDFWAKYTLVKE